MAINLEGVPPIDAVNPSHYTNHAVSPIELIRAYDLNFSCGNAIKYIARHKEKNGREDLKKALWYLLEELGEPIERIKEITNAIK